MESKDITLTFEQDWYNSGSAALMEAALYTCNELENQRNKMESRNIELTLEKAREWYNSGSADLKEVALQAYTEEELELPHWQSIKTFEDAYNALRMSYARMIDHIRTIEHLGMVNNLQKHLTAVYKLDLIRKALNKGWKPKMSEGTVYYPYIRYYPTGDDTIKISEDNNFRVTGRFKADGVEYSLIGGDYYCCNYGLGDYRFDGGGLQVRLGLFACKSKEIAEHMSKYFTKEIFDACYAQYIGVYEWVQ